MNENKRREWVKNAVIIFLVIMLLLTFFSNTIMNYSLPEVSAQYVSSGNLSEQIRGSGTVEANQSYEVKIGESRKIASVEVKSGDEIAKDQTLFKLEDSDSEELEAAERALREAKKTYDAALLSTGYDYRADELKISKQEEDIAAMKEELSKIAEYQKAYDEAKEKVREIRSRSRDIENSKSKLEKEAETYSNIITTIDSKDYESLDAEDYQKIQRAQTALDNAEKSKTKSENKIKEYESEIAGGGDAGSITAKRKAIEDKQLEISQTQKKINEAYFGGVGGSGENGEEGSEGTDISSLEAALERQNLDLKYLQEEYNNLLSQSSTYSRNKQLLDAEKNTLSKNQTNYDNAQKNLDKVIAEIKRGAKTKSQEISVKIEAEEEKLADIKIELEDAEEAEKDAAEKAAVSEEQQNTKIREAELALENAKIDLSSKQQADAVQAGKDALEIQSYKTAVDEAEEEVKKLREKSIGAEIKAPVGGRITSVNVSAGEDAAKETVVAVIEMSEKGYTLEITATVEQAKKVRVGDKAEIQYFWYGNAEAVLQNISPDKENPAKNRILKFGVTGDVTPGQTLQIAMGSKGQNYQYIVPNSAIREDNNGKFVLSVVAKSSPLGNRYIAERVNIEVLASDDTSSAVSGDILGGEFVISTSTKPIEAGKQVRLVEN